MLRHHQASAQVHKNRRDWANLKGMIPFLWEFRGVLFAFACLVLPQSLLLVYGVLKRSASLFNELCDILFAKVRYRAMRYLSPGVLAHLRNLSLRFQPGR